MQRYLANINLFEELALLEILLVLNICYQNIFNSQKTFSFSVFLEINNFRVIFQT